MAGGPGWMATKKGGKAMRGFRTIIVSLIAVWCVFLSTGARAAEMEFKAVGFLPKDHKLCAMIPVWIERANNDLKGIARITWVGGPEVMAPFNQPEAVRT